MDSRVLLVVIAKNPKAVEEALRTSLVHSLI
jgi:hypothetical protein